MEVNNSTPIHGLYGSQISRSKAVAYCPYHKAHLTVSMLKQHNCLGKQCEALRKHEHSYWVQREVLKARKKEKKMQRGLD